MLAVDDSASTVELTFDPCDDILPFDFDINLMTVKNVVVAHNDLVRVHLDVDVVADVE